MDERIFDSMAYPGDKSETATSMGVVIKSFIGVIIAFYVAMPRIAQGKYFGEFFYRGGFLSDLIGMLVFTFLIGILWVFITKALLVDKGVIVNALTYGAASVLSGLFLANSIIVAISWISTYGNVNGEIISYAINLTSLLTFVGVFAGILILPKIKMTHKTIKFAKNASLIVMGLAMASFIMVALGLLFAFLGMPQILQMWGSIFYGTGPISIIISLFGVFFAEILFLGTLAFVKRGIETVPKYQEYYLSIVMVNGVLRLYVEIFKLVLKVLAATNKRN